MSNARPIELDERVLLLAPTARDAATSNALLTAAGIHCFLCNNLDEVCREAARGAGAALVTAEAVLRDTERRLADLLDTQPPWSDLPLIVLNQPGPDSPRVLAALEAVGHMTLIKRPIQVSTLVSTINSALRDRRRQYAVRDLLDERRRSDSRKDDFIALLAHELRNPLAPIRNGLQVMRLASGDANAVAQARAMMDRQLGHMVRLIDDLLDISRISRNKMELRPARVLLADVVANAVETARPAIDAAGHELSLALPAQAIFLDADLTRLAQVFSNLLTNSAKYTERGGRIRLSAERQADTVTVSVSDTGIGIPPASLPSIFDMFSQVDRPMERSTGGLGIGLALVKGLVEMHGGKVAATSGGQGTGSKFTVTLPAVASLPELPENVVPDHNIEIGPQRRMLVVDDNEDSAASMAMMLRLLGNKVSVAHDGIEAIDAAERIRPEFILMDVGMPLLNGLDATRRIRQQPWGQTITIIALTGWGQDVDRVQSQEAGCDGHLVKPVNLMDLDELLSKLKSGTIGQ